MIINKNDIFISNNLVWISDDYVNTELENWFFTCIGYENKEYNRCHSSKVDKIVTKEEYPEYFL